MSRRPSKCPTGKRIYWAERLANRAVTNAAKRGELPPMRHYACPECGWWHLSKKTKERPMDDEIPFQVFYADPVDEDGNIIGTATMGPLSTPWGPVESVKVPHSELALEDADVTFDVKLPEPEEDA